MRKYHQDFSDFGPSRRTERSPTRTSPRASSRTSPVRRPVHTDPTKRLTYTHLVVANLYVPCRNYARGRCDDDQCKYKHRSTAHELIMLPWSSENIYQSAQGYCYYWHYAIQVLSDANPKDVDELVHLLESLLPPISNKRDVFPSDYTALRHAIALFSDAERSRFFGAVLPWMIAMVRHGPTHLARLPRLKGGINAELTLSGIEVCCIMCCGFFCLFPGRHRVADHSYEQYFNDRELYEANRATSYFNFGSLYRNSDRLDQSAQKLRCILEYFMSSERSSLGPNLDHTIQIVRRVGNDALDGLSKSDLPLRRVTMRLDGVIEDANGMLQVDFANRVPGGGVLGRGCVQEEIRFATCPELLVSRLICDAMSDMEVIYINGAAQFSAYTGYAASFAYNRSLPVTGVGCRDVSLVAMDAVNFSRIGSQNQYQPNWIERETNKAIVAFGGSRLSILPSVTSGPVSTGNWGCGAFEGDPELKLLIQWIAASFSGRDLLYFAFGNADLVRNFQALSTDLEASRCTVSQLYNALLVFHHARGRRGPSLFEFLKTAI